MGFEQGANLPPSESRLQTFGHAAVSEDGTLEIKLIGIDGEVKFNKTLTPEDAPSQPSSGGGGDGDGGGDDNDATTAPSSDAVARTSLTPCGRLLTSVMATPPGVSAVIAVVAAWTVLLTAF